ncbi:MAG: hypothetical protein ACLQVF_32700 [Isosphaeraceae bacterium]
MIPGAGQVAQYVDEPGDSISVPQAESAEAQPKEDEQGSAIEQPPRTPWWRDPAARKALLARDEEIQHEMIRLMEEWRDVRARLGFRKTTSDERHYKTHHLPAAIEPGDRKALLARDQEIQQEMRRLGEERRDVRARINGFNKKTSVPTGASADTAEIPPFEQDAGTDLNSDQERFFGLWKRRWEQGEAVDLGCNVGYLYTYARRHIKEPEDVIAQIPRLLSFYQGVSKTFTSLCQGYISDYYVLKGNYKRALREFPEIGDANKLLNLKRLVGVPVRASDLFALVGPELTKWGESNISAVLSEFDSFLERIEKESGTSLLVSWSLGKKGRQWHVFGGKSIKKPRYCYYADEEIIKFVKEGIRDAENRVRVDRGLPKVGEGWIAETTLYYQIRTAFKDFEVLQHAQPRWIGRQHLDIYIPQAKVALEYQGDQHERPVDFFGGEKVWKQTIKRDAAKLEKCLEAGVILIYVREGYDLEAIIKEIRELASATMLHEADK